MHPWTHVNVEPFHLFRYLDAECFRFNNRKNDDLGRFLLAVEGMIDKRLSYKQLIGKQIPEVAPSSASCDVDENGALPN
jgi:hypothetical protein